MRSDSGTGNGLRTTELMTLNMVALAPMHSARVATAVMAKLLSFQRSLSTELQILKQRLHIAASRNGRSMPSASRTDTLATISMFPLSDHSESAFLM